MCYNCGCGDPEDNMGNPDNITTETFKKAAKAENQTEEVAKHQTLALLQKELSSA